MTLFTITNIMWEITEDDFLDYVMNVPEARQAGIAGVCLSKWQNLSTPARVEYLRHCYELYDLDEIAEELHLPLSFEVTERSIPASKYGLTGDDEELADIIIDYLSKWYEYCIIAYNISY